LANTSTDRGVSIVAENQFEFDTEKKYVRITNERSEGFVEFDFAIGEPEVFAELILPRAAFEEFCESNGVTVLTKSDEPEQTESPWEWRLKDATTFI
jgi:phenol/toluene 2-monooxygenase (NADH) P0/A0